MEIIEIIKKQIERGASLISNVHKISKTEEIEQSKHSLNLNNVIESAIKQINLRFNEKDINIKKEVLEGLNVLGGEFLIDAIENILINAIIHNENKKIKIWIETSEIIEDNTNYIKIEFKDNGLGIIKKRKISIFERSHRLRKSTIGMGIGLSLVKKIINGYDGKVWVENRVKGDRSKGSNFIVLLKKNKVI
jgi:signal transduction histidine kinase